ncbi:MAG: hypothetical protein JEZ11_01385 [Desulfobacterales bacterium]|nr:hypothetical protein [Desulfobacterales bacterium]
MGTKQILGLIGSIILFVGVFTPIFSVPIMGNMNYFQNGKGDGTIVLVLAIERQRGQVLNLACWICSWYIPVCR